MKDKNIKLITALIVLFLLDIFKPFRYCLAVEFIFLGVLFVSTHYPLYFSIYTALVLGYLKDALSYGNALPSVAIFIILCIYIDYILHHFQRKLIKVFIIVSAVTIYTASGGISQESTTYGFMLFFIIQSVLIFLLINRFLEQWILPVSTADI